MKAKFGGPSNEYNEICKLFSNRLREAGCRNRNGRRIGFLLDSGGGEQFHEGVGRIDRGKIIQLGMLAPVDSVFV